MNHDYTPKWNEKFDDDSNAIEPALVMPPLERKSAVQTWVSESLLSPIIENKEEPEDTEKSTGKKKKRFLSSFKRSFSNIATTEAKKPTPSFTESLVNSMKGPEPQPAGTEFVPERQAPNARQNELTPKDVPEFPPPLPLVRDRPRMPNSANYEPTMINTPYQMARAETFAPTDPDLLVPEQSMVNKKTPVSAARAFFAAEFLSKRRDNKLEKEARKLKKQLAKQQRELEKQKARHTELAQNVSEQQASKSKFEQKLHNSAIERKPETSKETFFVPPVLTDGSAEQFSSNTERALSQLPETSRQETTIIHESEEPKVPEAIHPAPETYPYHLLARKEKQEQEQERKKYQQHQMEQIQESQQDTRRDADFDRRHEILDDSTKVVAPAIAPSGSRFRGQAPVPIARVLKDRERVQSKQRANRPSQIDDSSNSTQPQTTMYKQSVQYGVGTALVLFAFIIAASTIL